MRHFGTIFSQVYHPTLEWQNFIKSNITLNLGALKKQCQFGRDPFINIFNHRKDDHFQSESISLNEKKLLYLQSMKTM